MTTTSKTTSNRPHVTATAVALIKATTPANELLKLTGPVYGHSNREIIGRVWLDRLADIR